MTPDYVTVPIKIYPEAGNGELFVLCYFGGLSMRGFEVIKGSLWCPPPSPGRRKKKMRCQPRVKISFYSVFCGNFFLG